MASAEAPRPDALPVSDAEAVALFAPLRERAGLALAVSGGADSTALLHLVDRARHLAPLPERIVVLSVDHRLRPAARDEIEAVARLAAARGLPHRILTWDEATPGGNLQARAARARRRLLLDATREAGCDTLLLAHHADDQAETVLGRLARGSGVLGLAGMRPMREEHDLLLARPLLALPKARLVATLRDAGIAWCEDPSNADERFQRARLRAARPTLDALGLDRDRLTATARAMARAGAVIERLVGELDASAVARDPCGGWLSSALAPLIAADEEIRLRLLSRLVAEVAAADYGPRLEALEAFDAELRAAGPRGRLVRSLAGCRLELRRGRLWIAVELGRTPETLTLAPGTRGIWRGRPVCLAADAPASVTLAPLGRPARLAAARTTSESPPRDAAPPSAAVLETAPALFVDGRLVACPALPSACDEDAPRWLERVKFGR